MPTTRPRPNETREMRLFSKVIQLSKVAVARTDTTLPQFIARRRHPGETWRTWDEVRYELTEATGEIVTDATIRRWARVYGIPEGTQADGEGDVPTSAYLDALKSVNIDL
jgi:hypothetical protein